MGIAAQIGDVLDGRYRLVRVLGKGGMGRVFEAEHERIGRRVAIKVLHASLAKDTEVLRRFEREAQAATKIGSAHIADVFDVGETEAGEPFMVMEMLEGESLLQRYRRVGRMKAAELFPIVIEVLRGLSEAHAAGIIHRDLKPANVFLMKEREGRRDYVKVLDFGVSKFRLIGGEVTETGMILGTPHYMAPEQTEGAKYTDQRCDLYAVGVVLYRGLTGRVPFQADTMPELIRKLILEDPPPIASFVPEVHSEVVRLVGQALKRDPEERFQTAAEFANELQAFVDTLDENGVSSLPNQTTAVGQLAAGQDDDSEAETRIAPSSRADHQSMPSLATPWPSTHSIGAPKQRTGWLVGGVAVATTVVTLGLVATFFYRPGMNQAQPDGAALQAAQPSASTGPHAAATGDAQAPGSAQTPSTKEAPKAAQATEPAGTPPSAQAAGSAAPQAAPKASTKPPRVAAPPRRIRKPIRRTDAIRDDI